MEASRKGRVGVRRGDPSRRTPNERKDPMMHDMMGSGMMWGMGLLGVIGIIVLVLVTAALGKSVFFRGGGEPAAFLPINLSAAAGAVIRRLYCQHGCKRTDH